LEPHLTCQLGNGLNTLQELELVNSSKLWHCLSFSSCGKLAYQLHTCCPLNLQMNCTFCCWQSCCLIFFVTSKLTNADELKLMFIMLDLFSWIVLGVDSFYEYLLKAHILFGKEDYWRMFHSAYVAVQKHFRHGPWYHFNCKKHVFVLLVCLSSTFKIESYRRKSDQQL